MLQKYYIEAILKTLNNMRKKPSQKQAVLSKANQD